MLLSRGITLFTTFSGAAGSSLIASGGGWSLTTPNPLTIMTLVIRSFRSSPEVANSSQMRGFPSRKVLRRSWSEAGL